MADKKADTLANLFHDKSVFVHMGGSWGKEQEVNVIRSGGIHYNKADIHEVSVNIINETAILKATLNCLLEIHKKTYYPYLVTDLKLDNHGNDQPKC